MTIAASLPPYPRSGTISDACSTRRSAYPITFLAIVPGGWTYHPGSSS